MGFAKKSILAEIFACKNCMFLNFALFTIDMQKYETAKFANITQEILQYFSNKSIK